VFQSMAFLALGFNMSEVCDSTTPPRLCFLSGGMEVLTRVIARAVEDQLLQFPPLQCISVYQGDT
jgi:hypothetical protein